MLKKTSKENLVQVDAKVIEILPHSSTKFKVELPNKKVITAHLSGKIRINKIRVLVGDKVKVELSIYNFSEGRIIYRYT